MKVNTSPSAILRSPRSSWSRVADVVAAAAVGVVLLVAGQRPARADIVAAYVSGYGGLSSPQGDSAGSAGLSPALGAQAGVRLLGLEAYGDYTSLGAGAVVERGILGLRLGFEFGAGRLELRLGGGAISERGGALTGPAHASEEHTGGVIRAGVDLERRLARTLLAGFGVNGEWFSLGQSGSSNLLQATESRLTGSDVMATLHLKFELGI